MSVWKSWNTHANLQIRPATATKNVIAFWPQKFDNQKHVAATNATRNKSIKYTNIVEKQKQKACAATLKRCCFKLKNRRQRNKWAEKWGSWPTILLHILKNAKQRAKFRHVLRIQPPWSGQTQTLCSCWMNGLKLQPSSRFVRVILVCACHSWKIWSMSGIYSFRHSSFGHWALFAVQSTFSSHFKHFTKIHLCMCMFQSKDTCHFIKTPMFSQKNCFQHKFWMLPCAHLILCRGVTWKCFTHTPLTIFIDVPSGSSLAFAS